MKTSDDNHFRTENMSPLFMDESADSLRTKLSRRLSSGKRVGHNRSRERVGASARAVWNDESPFTRRQDQHFLQTGNVRSSQGGTSSRYLRSGWTRSRCVEKTLGRNILALLSYRKWKSTAGSFGTGASQESWMASLQDSPAQWLLVSTFGLPDSTLWTMDKDRGPLEADKRLPAKCASRSHSRCEIGKGFWLKRT